MKLGRIEVAARGNKDQDPAGSWGFAEWFVVVQFLSPALLLLPGAQEQRFLIRALPYLASAAGLLVLLRRGQRHRTRRRGIADDAVRIPAPRQPAVAWMVGALVVLLLAQLHPATVQPAGLAQLLFQITIVGPLFWAGSLVTTTARLRRLIWIIFVANALGVMVGLLQVLDPDRFLPPEFSRVGLALNPHYVEALSYTSSSGKRIVRPPGLTDTPGGAALAGMICGFLGIVLSSLPGASPVRRLVCLGVAAGGMGVLYLTQVRSLFMVMLVCLVAMGALMARRRVLTSVAWIAVSAVVLTIASFDWATRLGGANVAERFLQLKDESMFDAYNRERGHFLRYTLTELLDEHPFGAGTGRWGMMNVYFGPKDPMAPQPIHVEIQLTGWLIDGGILLWLTYGGAIVVALAAIVGRTAGGIPGNLPYYAGVVACLNLGILAQSFAGPAFNTQLGIQFWFLAAALGGIPASTASEQGRRKQFGSDQYRERHPESSLSQGEGAAPRG